MTKKIERAVNKLLPILEPLLEPYDELEQELIVLLALETLQKKEKEYVEELKSLR